jgi:dolichol-phosphate mannosyltransferase
MRADLTIVIPTFNERANVRPMLALLDAALGGIAWEAVYVDDDSPDGTAEEVRAAARDDDRVHLIHRIGRRGLAGACIEGILSATTPLVAVIDADLQHDETKLAEMVARFRADPQLDLVIGSRHVDGGSIGEGFTATRARGSEIATRLAKRLLKIEASDPMSGFFMVRRESFNQVVTGLQTQGFKILADMLAAAKGRWKVAEVGYTFRDRRHGESKLDAAVTAEFLALLVARMTGGVLPIRLILFLSVGATGVIVQLAAMRLALLAGIEPFWIAQTFGVWVAMTTNFLLNNVLTYHDRTLRGRALVTGLFSFYAVCAVGAVANVGVADVVYTVLPQAEVASATGAVVGALWNFVASALVTWRAR